VEKNPEIYLAHMLEAVANIEMDTKGYDFAKFRKDRRARQLVERNLEILSEASRRVPENMKLQEAAIPWKEIAGIGNILRHEYHQTYPTILWETCQKDLKPLKEAVARMKKRVGVQEKPQK
jgi:uncharacterized protein with HEPN domain